MSDDIVVVGRREQKPDGTARMVFSIASGVPPGVRFVRPREVSEDGSGGEPELVIAVAIEKTDEDTPLEDLRKAAEALILAVERIVAALEQVADLTRTVTVLGKEVTLGELQADLLATKFTVTDRVNFNNNGVGGASRGSGSNTDVINYRAIIGGPNGGGYADPGFPDNSGMNSLILHELGHLSQIGYDFWQRSMFIHNADQKVDSRDFYNSSYGRNLESFANQIMSGAAHLLGFDLHGVRPGNPNPPISAESIYESNNGKPFKD